MATYRVGVVLTASGASFESGFRRAQQSVRRTDSALARAAGSAGGVESALRRTSNQAGAFGRAGDSAGRRAQSALQRASGSAGGVESALRRTSNQARRTGEAIGAASARGGRSVDRLIARFGRLRRAMRDTRHESRQGPGGGYGAGMAARAAGAVGGGLAVASGAAAEIGIADLYERLGIEAKRSPEEMLRVRRRVEAVAAEKGVGHQELLGSVLQYQRRVGGDLDENLLNLDVFAEAVQRSGGRGVDIANYSAELRKIAIDTPEQLREGMVMTIEAQREGSLYLADLASRGGRMISQWAPHEQGLDALRNILIAAEASAEAAGGRVDEGMTQITSALASLRDPVKLAAIEKLGVYGATERSPEKVWNDLVNAVDGDMTKLANIFGQEAIGLFTFLSTETGQRFRSKVAEGIDKADLDVWTAEVQRGAATTKSEQQVIQDRTQSLFSRALGGSIQTAITTVAAHQDTLMAVGMGAFATRAAWRGGRGALDAWRRYRGGRPGAEQPAGRGGRRGPAAGGFGATGSVRTMHVATLIAGRTVGGGLQTTAGRGGAGRGGATRGAAGGILRRTATGGGNLLRRVGGRAGPWAAGAFGVLGVGSALAAGDRAGAVSSAAGAAGGVGGGVGGAKLGALAGTAIMPGVGTIVGAIVGGLTGALAGDWLGRAAADSLLGRLAGADPTPSRDQRRRQERQRFLAAETDLVLDRAAGADPAAPLDLPVADHDGGEPSRDQRRRQERQRFLAAETDLVLDRAAGADPAAPLDLPVADHDGGEPSRDQRRRQERQRFLAAETEKESLADLAERVLKQAQGDRAYHDNRSDNRSVTIQSPTIQVHSENGDPQQIAEEASEKLVDMIVERVREELARDGQRLLDTTFWDPDPTIP